MADVATTLGIDKRSGARGGGIVPSDHGTLILPRLVTGPRPCGENSKTRHIPRATVAITIRPKCPCTPAGEETATFGNVGAPIGNVDVPRCRSTRSYDEIILDPRSVEVGVKIEEIEDRGTALDRDPVRANPPRSAVVYRLEDVLWKRGANRMTVGGVDNEIAVPDDHSPRVLRIKDRAISLILTLADDQLQGRAKHRNELHAANGVDPVDDNALDVLIEGAARAVQHNGALIVVDNAIADLNDEATSSRR